MKLIGKELVWTDSPVFEGYAELYKEESTDISGNKHTAYYLGESYPDLDKKPKRVEYPISTHKPVGTVKIRLEKI